MNERIQKRVISLLLVTCLLLSVLPGAAPVSAAETDETLNSTVPPALTDEATAEIDAAIQSETPCSSAGCGLPDLQLRR